MTFQVEKDLALFIKELGGELWIVGGCLRDEAMGLPTSDRDYVVTGIEVDKIPFEKVVGSDFPVFLVEVGGIKCEVALARTEMKDGKGYHGFKFFTAPHVNIQDDLARRDLTMNAMARNVLTGRLFDPLGGIGDIKAGILRHTSTAFIDDPLRVYRVARFAAKFPCFVVAKETMTAMIEMKGQLEELKNERVSKEFFKAMECRSFRKFFDVLRRADLLDVHFTEIADLEVPDMHDGTAYEHTMRLLEHADSMLMKFALLVHDFGKGRTSKNEHPKHHGHDKLGVEPFLEFCKRLRIPFAFMQFGSICVREHMRVKKLDEMRPAKLIQLLMKHTCNTEELLRMSFIDSAFREGGNQEQEQKRLNDFTELIAKARRAIREVNGDTLIAEGKIPSPRFGDILLNRRIEKLKTMI